MTRHKQALHIILYAMTAYQFIEIAIATTLSTFYHVSATDLQHCGKQKQIAIHSGIDISCIPRISSICN